MRVSEVVTTLIALAVVIGVGGPFLDRFSVGTILDIVIHLASLIWLFFLVKIPWDLYFSARKARLDGEESRRLGIEGVEQKIRQLAAMERYLLLGAVSAHILTAAGVYALGSFEPDLISRQFGWVFVASAALRPAWEGYTYLRQRIREMATQVRYPREDVLTLSERVREQLALTRESERKLVEYKQEMSARIQRLESHIQILQSEQVSESARSEKRTVQLSHKFEEVVEKISSDQDLVAGARAFARMLRGEVAPG